MTRAPNALRSRVFAGQAKPTAVFTLRAVAGAFYLALSWPATSEGLARRTQDIKGLTTGLARIATLNGCIHDPGDQTFFSPRSGASMEIELSMQTEQKYSPRLTVRAKCPSAGVGGYVSHLHHSHGSFKGSWVGIRDGGFNSGPSTSYPSPVGLKPY